jgi:hypothetical protein
VRFDARVGSLTDNPPGGSPNPAQYDPVVAKVPGLASLGPEVGWTNLPGTVHLCNTWKMDFSILVEKGLLPEYSGLMQLRALTVPFAATANVEHPDSGAP